MSADFPKYDLANAGSDANSVIDYTEIAMNETGYIDLVDQMKEEAAMCNDFAELFALCSKYIDMANEQIGD